MNILNGVLNTKKEGEKSSLHIVKKEERRAFHVDKNIKSAKIVQSNAFSSASYLCSSLEKDILWASFPEKKDILNLWELGKNIKGREVSRLCCINQN